MLARCCFGHELVMMGMMGDRWSAMNSAWWWPRVVGGSNVFEYLFLFLFLKKKS